MAKGKGLKKLPGSFVNAKPQPSLYTDDPNVAPASTIKAIGENFRKARESMKGKPSTISQSGQSVTTSISPANTNAPDAAIA